MKNIPRVKTGIKGLDELIGGGIPVRSSILLAGGAGSGKTTIAMEFLYNGVTKFGENGVFISFEEGAEDLKRNLPFDWDLDSLISSKKLLIVRYDPYQYEDIIDLIRTNVKEINAKRVVIDSLTALNLYVENVKDVRKLIIDINEQLSSLGCTSIYTGEIKSDVPQQISRFGVEEFIADGVILLLLNSKGSELTNAIWVRKMRGTKHDKKMHPFKFGENGIVVYSKEVAFSELKRTSF